MESKDIQKCSFFWTEPSSSSSLISFFFHDIYMGKLFLVVLEKENGFDIIRLLQFLFYKVCLMQNELKLYSPFHAMWQTISKSWLVLARCGKGCGHKRIGVPIVYIHSPSYLWTDVPNQTQLLVPCLLNLLRIMFEQAKILRSSIQSKY